MNTNYLVIAPLPFKLFKVGSIVEATDELSKFIDFSDKKFFKPSVPALYAKFEKVFIKGSKDMHFILEDPSLGLKGEFVYKVSMSKNPLRYDKVLNIKESDIIKINKFWFINSNGVVCEDFENRPKLDKEGLAWKKLIGNYFVSQELAGQYKIKMFSTNFIKE